MRRCCFRNVTSCFLCNVCVNIWDLYVFSCYDSYIPFIFLWDVKLLCFLCSCLKDSNFLEEQKAWGTSSNIWNINTAYGFQGFGICLHFQRKRDTVSAPYIISDFRNSTWLTEDWHSSIKRQMILRVKFISCFVVLSMRRCTF